MIEALPPLLIRERNPNRLRFTSNIKIPWLKHFREPMRSQCKIIGRQLQVNSLILGWFTADNPFAVHLIGRQNGLAGFIV